MNTIDQTTNHVARSVLSERVRDRIVQWTLEGELTPGSRIIETRGTRADAAPSV